MGSTLVAIWLKNDKAHIVWCGDSRCYLYRNNLRLLTEDHSLVNDYVRRGLISLEASRKHPSKHVLTQVLGDESNQVRPDSLTIELVENDIFLLCSDGLNNMLSDEKIANVIENGANMSENLLTHALHSGGNDNISIIIIEVKKKA
jgi:protein phosphatase